MRPNTTTSRCTIAAAALSTLAGAASAAIDLSLVPTAPSVEPGETVHVELRAASDGATAHAFSAINLIVGYDPATLRLVGNDDAGGAPLLSSGFGADPYGLNEALPPADGDGLYVAYAFFGSPVPAPPEGVLVTTLEFEALAPDAGAAIDILPAGGAPEGQTVVFDGTTPNLPVTGALAGATLVVEGAAPCPEDVDGSGVVDVNDVLVVLSDWGIAKSPADVDGTGLVDVADLIAVLTAWGACT